MLASSRSQISYSGDGSIRRTGAGELGPQIERRGEERIHVLPGLRKNEVLAPPLHSSQSSFSTSFFRKIGRNRAITSKATNLVSNIPRGRAPGIKVMGREAKNTGTVHSVVLTSSQIVPHHLSRFDTHPKLETAHFMTSCKGRGLDLDDLMKK